MTESARAESARADEIQRQSYDVVVIGAGGSGLRAAIEARLRGKKTAIISKSLFGKAHTVMAEGGAAAAMGNQNPHDNSQVHFRDTMRGGKFLNNWRMAELHANEAPDRVWELEAWGAVFDRTPDGKISQRNFGGQRGSGAEARGFEPRMGVNPNRISSALPPPVGRDRRLLDSTVLAAQSRSGAVGLYRSRPD
jgi:succinate dehydrogenase/fumarate reductase flavoprotein subunit